MNNKIIDTERKTPGEIMKMLCINFSIAFTLFMLFSMFFGIIYADEEARAGIMYCWTIAGRDAFGSCLAARILHAAPHPPSQLRCAHRIVRRVLLCGPHTACDRLWLVSH